MATMSKNRAGLVTGLFFGLFHLIWALLVAMGFAQIYMDWIFRLHFIQPPYTLQPFSWSVAGLLIAVTSVLGYIFGWLFGAIWNLLHPTS
jgi:hypothetical protein